MLKKINIKMMKYNIEQLKISLNHVIYISLVLLLYNKVLLYIGTKTFLWYMRNNLPKRDGLIIFMF